MLQARKMQTTPDLVEQCKTANTHIIYELRLGNNTGETGLIQMERYSHVEKGESGNFAEIPEDTVYFDYDLHEENAELMKKPLRSELRNLEQ